MIMERPVLKLFALIKCIQLLFFCVVPVKFDSSSDVYLTHKGYTNQLLNNFIVWDNVYFTKLFNEELTFEHEFVFSPFFTGLIRQLPLINGFYLKLIAAIIFTNINHLVTCIILSKLTKLYFPVSKYNQKIDQLSSIFCVLSVAGVFLTCSYSESTCMLLTITSLYLRESSLQYFKTDYKISKFLKYFISASLIALAFGVRSNSILFGIVYLYDSINFLLHFKLGNMFKALISGFTIFLALCHSIGSGYLEFCPMRGEWCYDAFPSLLVYAQSHYWNNGFLNYWTPNNIPNFLFMVPNFCIFLSSVNFFKKNHKLRPLILTTIVYLILNFFFWHVQIMNRISSFIPINYWYLAHLYYKNRKLLNLTIFYLVIWNFLQTGLFTLFLPPA